jgi:hypothetical protein
MKHLLSVSVLASLASLVISADRSLAVPTLSESFETTTYKDAGNTTAFWDTDREELGLHPFAPSLVGAYDTPGGAYAVAVAGDLAFVADLGAGLQIINITNPGSPTFVGTYDTPGIAYSVAVDGDLAFVADDEFGLQIINVSNPASPTLVARRDLPMASKWRAISPSWPI